MSFSCDFCGLHQSPAPCSCPRVEDECDACGDTQPAAQIAPGIWICPGCVDMHRRRAA